MTSSGPASARVFGIEISTPVFDRATRLARSLFAGSESMVILVRGDEVWRSRPASAALPNRDGAAEIAIASGELVWIEDGRADPRFAASPVVTGPPYIRSYIGAPIKLDDGTTPGVLCVASTEPQAYDPGKAARLQDLADFVADEWRRALAAHAQAATQSALEQAMAMLTALGETSPIAIVMADKDLNVIGASRVWAADHGTDPFAVVGRKLTEITPIYDGWADDFAACLAGQAQPDRLIELTRAGGERAWMQTSLTAWRDPAGAIGGLVIAAIDVTELKAALDQAEKSEERLKLALSLANVHVWELDYVRRELHKAGAEDTFFERPQTYDDLYRDIYLTIDPRDRAMVQEAWRRHVEEGAPYRPEYRIARTDGKEIWAEGVIEFFADAKGRPQRMVGAIRNTTDRKLAEQALVEAREAAEAANQAKSTFLATISHEIRTPLNGVLGMAQAMAADQLPPAQRQRLDVIRQSGETLLTLLNDVLDISKIEANRLELESAAFDIEDLALGVRAAFEATARSKGVALSAVVETAAKGAYVGDPTRVRQILYNLVSNAVKFTDGGEVRVRVRRARGGLAISVADTGVGIPTERLEGIFGKFEQADVSTTRRFGGTGLGLSISRELAELMGGAIEVKSRPDRGSTFTVRLPLPRASAPAPSHRDALASETLAAPAERPLRVLAAEDNEVNQLVLRTLLEQAGIQPMIVGDGAAAVEAWESGPWDLILMDVQMPGMDGPDAARAIRAREAERGLPPTPIVALTANVMSHQLAEYRAAGMDGFVGKPIAVAELFAAIDAALAPAAESAASAA